MWVAIIVGGFVALVVVIAWIVTVLQKKRRLALQAAAARLGLQFFAVDPYRIDGHMPHRLFTMGDGRGCENVMAGDLDGFPIREFDYWYYNTHRSSKGHEYRTYHRYSCAMTTIPASCPPLRIARESLFSRAADAIGMRDIEMESEDFNRAWTVGGDRQLATALLDQRMIEWLLSVGGEWSLEIAGPNVLVYAHRMSPGEIDELVDCIRNFTAHIPHVVTSLYGRAAGGGRAAG